MAAETGRDKDKSQMAASREYQAAGLLTQKLCDLNYQNFLFSKRFTCNV